VEERKQKAEELKDQIYKVYSNCYNPSLDRQNCTGQLWALASNWCKFIVKNDEDIFYEENLKINKDKVKISFNEIGEEIFLTILEYLKKEEMPKEDFLYSFRVGLINAINSFHRKKVVGALREPGIIRKMRKIIEDEEANKGRKLTQDEKIYHIHELTSLRRETILEHLIGMERKFINFITNDEDEVVEMIEIMEGHSLTAQGPVSEPQNEEKKEVATETFINALETVLETVLNEYQEKTKPFYRALFTILYIKNNKDYKKIKPILSAEILEMFEQNGKIPTQYEIYMKYHPGAKKSTAETNASQMSKKFYADINKAIEEKYPEFKF